MKKKNKIKQIKKLSRMLFLDIPMSTKVFEDKKKYSRKIKHKKRNEEL